MKPTWEKPKLVVLVRRDSEEVLTNDCKHPSTPVGAAAQNTECALLDPNCKRCFAQDNKS